MDYLQNYEKWCNDEFFDEATRRELADISSDKSEIEERFYKDLEFGTAGLRGILGAGTNRMNIYTVRKATQGLADYIISCGKSDCGVAIAYDCRNMSPEFADEAARCLAANNIKAYVFDELRPTPELSFAVRYLGCVAGINITASHNPAKYNGYKVYWSDGAQITPPHDVGIMDKVKAIDDYSYPKTMSKEDAVKAGLYQVIGKELDDAYIKELKALITDQDAIDKYQKNIKIVFTPLHGTGNKPVRRLLKEIGFENVFVVPQQEKPDGNFPTVNYPNPESQEAFTLAMDIAIKEDADIIMATDPDADRLGVYVRETAGKYHSLTGNMSGCLIGEYICERRTDSGNMPSDARLVKSIVTTNMLDAIADNYNAKLEEVLTGFKYIGQKMLEYEKEHTGSYVFGMEESYGCLPGTYARDKDAVAATMMLSQAAAYYMSQGKSLWDVMVGIYDKYGYYKDDVYSITLEGKAGIEKIQSVLDVLEEKPPKKIGEYDVLAIRNYRKDERLDCKDNSISKTSLPKSNVLYYELENAAWVCVRPSGTEPKLKMYYGIRGNDFESAKTKGEALSAALKELVDGILNAE